MYQQMRKVIVTGGSRGIGAACVAAFRENGDAVAFIYRESDEKAAEITEKTGAVHFKYDLKNYNNTIKAISAAQRALGGCDVLVCAAGIDRIAQICDTTEEDWNSIIGVNLTSVFAAVRTVSPGMIRRKSGRIITLGSVWGARGASCEVAYSASKAGLRGLTMALGKELGPSGITVNCIEPGVIDTDMNACLDGETRRELADSIALGRFGSPSEIARVVLFLASEKASYINGACIPVDGGFVG